MRPVIYAVIGALDVIVAGANAFIDTSHAGTIVLAAIGGFLIAAAFIQAREFDV